MQRRLRKGLTHKRAHATDDAMFFEEIDRTGGWPLDYRYVGFCHSEDREAGFCNSATNDGWWTVIASADDYYLWKLSPEALKRISESAVRYFIDQLSSNIDPSKVYYRTSAGRRAWIQKEIK